MAILVEKEPEWLQAIKISHLRQELSGTSKNETDEMNRRERRAPERNACETFIRPRDASTGAFPPKERGMIGWSSPRRRGRGGKRAYIRDDDMFQLRVACDSWPMSIRRAAGAEVRGNPSIGFARRNWRKARDLEPDQQTPIALYT